MALITASNSYNLFNILIPLIVFILGVGFVIYSIRKLNARRNPSTSVRGNLWISPAVTKPRKNPQGFATYGKEQIWKSVWVCLIIAFIIDVLFTLFLFYSIDKVQIDCANPPCVRTGLVPDVTQIGFVSLISLFVIFFFVFVIYYLIKMIRYWFFK